jgi:hypothetical protein
VAVLPGPGSQPSVGTCSLGWTSRPTSCATGGTPLALLTAVGRDRHRLRAQSLIAMVALMGLAAAVVGVGAGEPPAASAPPRTAHRTATGRLTAYDGAARTLTLRSVTGLSLFHLAEDARVWLGCHRLPAERLDRHLGAQATVAWADVDGVRVTHTVRLNESDPPARIAGDGGR